MPNQVNRSDGQSYAPEGKPRPVVGEGEFVFAVAYLHHGHIYGQTNGLLEAGGTLRWVFDEDAKRLAAFQAKYPQVQVARSLDEILDDHEVKLVAAAHIPSERAELGFRVMGAGKDYFTDKTPFTTLEQLAKARHVVAETDRKYLVYYSERLHVESAVHAGALVHSGAIGRVVQVTGLGPHRLSKPSRPDWFFERARYGGIICDIGSHQYEQYLFFSGATDAEISHAAVGNFANPDTPQFEDFGESVLIGDNATTHSMRVDWFTPNGLSTWGDGRTLILGTKGYIELRKFTDIARQDTPDHLYLVDDKGEHHVELAGKVGFPFFGAMILDCLNRTELAMTQQHTFKAAELCLKAQAAARNLTPTTLTG